MDFFGILFDIKNGKKVPYSKTYFDTLFAESLAGVTTITGTLPLTFTTSETALRSWTIYGADIEHVETASGKSITFYTDEDKLRDWTIYGNADGVGERTKNIADINGIDITQYGVRWYAENGYIRAVGKYRDNAPHTQPRFYYQLAAGDYVVSGSPDYADTNIRIQIGTCDDDQGTNYNTIGYDEGSGFSFTIEKASWIVIRMYTAKALYNQDIDLTIPLMLRKSDTSPEFIPYGYQIPITVLQTGQMDKTYDIFVGDSPLTEGETVSKTSTGVDIATTDGNNTITTSLYNQPDMSITYNEFTGVGILTANLFIIALKLQAGGQTLNVFNITLNKPLRAGETLTGEQTGKTIKTVAGVENKLSPAPKVASYGGSFDMTIKFKE